LFSSVSLFVLIDAGKNDAFGGWRMLGIGISPARRTLGEGGLPMGHWLGNQCRSTQHRQPRDLSGLAH